MPVKVVPRSLTEAYKKREGDFAPNLVGFQATKAPLYTLGNFEVTTNLESKLNKDFNLGGEWSDYYSLDNLNLSQEESKLLESNQFFIDLNYDSSKIDRYVHYGSLSEFLRVNIEEVITQWKGSLYIDKELDQPTLNTVLTYSYDSSTNLSTFRIPTTAVVNNFNLIYENNSEFSTIVGDITNLTTDFDKYFLWNEHGGFIITNYLGSTDNNPYIEIEVYGESWPDLTGTTFGSYTYHIRPLPEQTEIFFLGLNDFQKYMLNRMVTPKYSFYLDIPKELDNGNFVNEKEKFTWPTTDGYNLDIKGTSYGQFIDSLFDSARRYDRNKSDLISRKYVSTSIHEYDTPGEGTNETGQKVQKLLRIYGRSFDDIKKYIEGISFANVVTYNKRDNTSDDLIKFMAKTLGLDTLETIFGDNFSLVDYNTSDETPTFQGHSKGYSPKEIEVEFWRRLVINAWWLWKSKGTRKVLEFFLKMFGISDTFIDLDEYVYVASKRLDTAKVLQQIEEYFEIIGEPIDADELTITNYPMDEFGYPRPLDNNDELYFQSDGGWYNGGTEITEGNNPHFGPYDFGSKYFKSFTEFIPNQITSFTGDPFEQVFDIFDGGYGNLAVGTIKDFEGLNPQDNQSEFLSISDAKFKYVVNTPNCTVPPEGCGDGFFEDENGNCVEIKPDDPPKDCNFGGISLDPLPSEEQPTAPPPEPPPPIFEATSNWTYVFDGSIIDVIWDKRGYSYFIINKRYAEYAIDINNGGEPGDGTITPTAGGLTNGTVYIDDEDARDTINDKQSASGFIFNDSVSDIKHFIHTFWEFDNITNDGTNDEFIEYGRTYEDGPTQNQTWFAPGKFVNNIPIDARGYNANWYQHMENDKELVGKRIKITISFEIEFTKDVPEINDSKADDVLVGVNWYGEVGHSIFSSDANVFTTKKVTSGVKGERKTFTFYRVFNVIEDPNNGIIKAKTRNEYGFDTGYNGVWSFRIVDVLTDNSHYKDTTKRSGFKVLPGATIKGEIRD
jgi:hypothetical protein